jgi:hypothetical protein
LDDADLPRFCMEVPWEKVRLRRLLDGFASRDAATRQFAESHAPLVVRLEAPRVPADLIAGATRYSVEPNPRQLAALRAAVLQVALRLYQAECGKPAERLTDLVPKYLPAVPLDPYDGQPYRYRLSRGEEVGWPAIDPLGGNNPEAMRTERSVRQIPPGYGILWCVGEDGKDDDGRAQSSPYVSHSHPGEDVITLVPPEPR